MNKVILVLNLRNHYIDNDSKVIGNDLTKVNLDENKRMITFDIKDLWVNISKRKLLGLRKLYN
jgi:hypothetical protein